MRPAGCAALLCFVAVAVGCSSDTQTAVTAQVRDSAGITIVENADPVWDERRAWRLSSSPIVTIGVVEGDAAYELFRTIGAVRLSDRRIVLASLGTHELRLYDPQGIHLLSVGGEGEGPGEFRGLSMIGRFAGDSLMAYDMMQQRISIFGADGEHVRDLSLATGGQFVFPVLLGRLEDGSYLGQVSSRRIGPDAPELKPGEFRDSILALRVSADGTTTDTVGVFPSAMSVVRTLSFGGNATQVPVGVHFSPMSLLTPAGTGMIVGTSDTYTLRYYDAGGDLRRIVRKESVPLQVTQADVDSLEAQTLATIASQNVPAALTDVLKDRPAAETMPAFRALRTDTEHNLWVEEYRRPGDDIPRWSVFDPEGYFLGVVTGPEGLRVTDIGTDYVMGIVTDDMDVQRVVMYELVKPGG